MTEWENLNFFLGGGGGGGSGEWLFKKIAHNLPSLLDGDELMGLGGCGVAIASLFDSMRTRRRFRGNDIGDS